MRRSLACLVLLAAGCATTARPPEAAAPTPAPPVEKAAPRYEHIFMMPVDMLSDHVETYFFVALS